MLSKLKQLYKNTRIFSLMFEYKNSQYRKKLKNKNFSIICNNCIGGILYNRFGAQFLSPTINLSINPKEFCNFLMHFEYYIEKDIIPSGFTDSNLPIGKITGNGKDIPDIQLVFVHYKDFEDGRSKWNTRKKRINKDNIFLIITDQNSDLSNEDLKKVAEFKCVNKVVFTNNKNINANWACYIKSHPKKYLLRNIFGSTLVERKFDFASFFNKSTK